MKHNILATVLLTICAALDLHAVSSMPDYTGRPLSEALAEFSRNHPDLKISFIYDELENYRVKGKNLSDNPLLAIRELVAFNPVSVSTDGEEIYIEAMQKGKYRYSGRTIGSASGEPVGFATVMLLNPKDSTAVTYGVTDEAGYFSIPCDLKNVIAKFSSVGYKTIHTIPTSFSMGDIKMDILALKLNDVVATAEARYALSDHTVFVPSAREKRAARGGADLLQFMAIPSINVNPADNSISTLSGQDVATFIDYMRASADDLKSLRPEDVKKVEVYDYPADPRFEGARHAVNFIMAKYEYGGYTKLSARQRLDFDYGYYSLSSKFSYGRMTYDVYTGYDHFKADNEYVNSGNSYDFGSRKVDWNKNTTDAEVENNEAYLSTRAKYVSKNTVISNQLSIRRIDVPRGRQVSENIYIPEIYPRSEASETYDRHTLNPSWTGNYQFVLPNAIRLVVTPSATYSHNKNHSYFYEDGTDILNNVKEDAWSAKTGVAIGKNWDANSLTLTLIGELTDNNLTYTGDNPAEIHYNFRALGARLGGNLSLGKLRLQPSARFFYSRTTFGDGYYNQPLPSYFISGQINFGRRHQMSFSSEMSQWTIGASQRSPNIVVRNLLSAVKGNPDLKTWLYNAVDADYTWLPLQNFNISAYCSYLRHTKPMDYVFEPIEIDGREMMLRTYIKDGYFQKMSAGVSAVARFFDNSLVLRGTGSFSAYRRGGRRRYDRNVVNGTLSGSYYLGDFYFTGYYEFREKSATTFYQTVDRPAYYSLGCGWSKAGWNISLDLKNLFRSSYSKGSDYMAYENFSSEEMLYGAAYRRSVWVNVVYTVRYGRKVKMEQIDRGQSTSSGIVN